MSKTEKYAALAMIAGALTLAVLLRDILAPFLIGATIAYLGDPLVDRLERLGVNRTLGVSVVFLVLTAMLTGAVLILVPMLIREIISLVSQLPEFVGWLQKTVSPLLMERFGVDPFAFDLNVLSSGLTGNWQKAGDFAGIVLREVSRSGLALMAALGNLLLIPVVAFYLMRDWDDVMERLRSLLPRETEPHTVLLAKECDSVLSAFLRGQLLIMLTLGVIYAVGLSLIGVDLAFLIGLLAGLASIVPYLGFIVGIGAASAAALFQFGDPVMLVYVLAVFGFGQALEGMVLTPLLVGDRIGLHPVAVIFAVLAGGQLAGLVGILIALPVAAVVMVFVRHLRDRYLDSEYYTPGMTEAGREDGEGHGDPPIGA